MTIFLKRKKIFQKEKRHSSVFWKAFQIAQIIFHFIGTLNCQLKLSASIYNAMSKSIKFKIFQLNASSVENLTGYTTEVWQLI